MIKRFGYALEISGKDYYPELKKFIDTTYIPLDYSKRKTTKKNKKWGLIINAWKKRTRKNIENKKS